MTHEDTGIDRKAGSAKTNDTIEIGASQVIAGTLAAITAAVLGSMLGVAGTVVGAGIGSIVTTVGAALYLRSIQRTRQRVRTVRALVIGVRPGDRAAGAGDTTNVSDGDNDAGGATNADDGAEAATNADHPTNAEAATNAEGADQTAGDHEEDRPDPASTRRRPGWAALLAGSVLAFALGMLVITGVEWLRGEPLSGGNGTTVGGIVAPGRDERPVDRPSTEPSPPAEENTTPAPPPSGDPTAPTNPTNPTKPPTTPQAPEPTGSTPPPTTTPRNIPPSEASNPPSVTNPVGP